MGPPLYIWTPSPEIVDLPPMVVGAFVVELKIFFPKILFSA